MQYRSLKFRKLAVKKIPQIAGEKSVQAILQKLNLLEKGKLRRAALLLFGKNPKKFHITAYIKIGKFVSATDLISTGDIEGNLFDQVDKAIEMLKVKHLLSNITYEGIYRKDNMEFQEEALREQSSTPCFTAITWVRTPSFGSIRTASISGMKAACRPVSSLRTLKKWHLSRPRNELLADVFFKADMIEAWGRGTVKIGDECRKAGLPEPEFKEEFGGLSVHFRKADKAQEAQVDLLNWQKYRLTDKGRQLVTGMQGDKKK